MIECTLLNMIQVLSTLMPSSESLWISSWEQMFPDSGHIMLSATCNTAVLHQINSKSII